MASWAGFSEEELRKVKKSARNDQDRGLKGPKQCSYKRTEPRHTPGASTNNIRVSANHSRPAKSFAETHTAETAGQDKVVIIKTEPVDPDDVIKTVPVDPDNVIVKKEIEADDRILDLDDKEALSHDLKSMEKFQQQQKQIEEANKQKKALLAKTLTERKKAAKEETHKLEHIQKELSKLDTLLTADVQVIRGKIEDASREFMDAQKRFDKAETEYVAAKVELHHKKELKEQLTEHLYTIIHQNEVRKAKKLANLMKTLEMESGAEEDLSLPELPPLTSFQPTNVHLHTHPQSVQETCSRSQSETVNLDSDNTVKPSESSNESAGCADNSLHANKDTTEIQPVEAVSEQSSGDNSGKPSTSGSVSETLNSGKNVLKETENDSDDVAVDLSIVKKEVVDYSLTVSESSTPHMKSKWDFDGTVT